MSLWQRLVVALQLVAALGAELSKLAAPGAAAVVPPEGLPAVKVSTPEADFELRVHVRRTR